MNIVEVIKTRKSIRKYLDKPVLIEEVLPLIESAMYAPSAHNEQLRHFIVVNDKSMLQELSEFHGRLTMAKHASIGILICADMEKDVSNGFWPQDCAAATQNLLLAAHGFSFGAVWTGIYSDKLIMSKFSSFFDLPKHIIPFSFVPIGYPAEIGIVGNRFKQDRIHINQR